MKTVLTVEVEIIQDDVHGAVKEIIDGVLKAYSHATFSVLSWKVAHEKEKDE